MQEADARRIATAMAELMRSEFIEEQRQPPATVPVSLRDILETGIYVTQTVRQTCEIQTPGQFPATNAMLAAFACLQFNPSPWIHLITEALMQSAEDPTELEAAILNTRVPKAMIAGAMSDFASDLKERQRQYTADDKVTMFQRWEALQPAIVALLDLQFRYPATQAVDALQMLAPSFPGITTHLHVHLATMQTFRETPAYAEAKRIDTKAALLASAIVAVEFDMEQSYCIQRMQEMRRFTHGRQRISRT